MVDDPFGTKASEGFRPDADDIKKKIAAQSKQADGQTIEDQSRGVLHYGESHEAEIGDDSTARSAQLKFSDTRASDPESDTFHPAPVDDSTVQNPAHGQPISTPLPEVGEAGIPTQDLDQEYKLGSNQQTETPVDQKAESPMETLKTGSGGHLNTANLDPVPQPSGSRLPGSQPSEPQPSESHSSEKQTPEPQPSGSEPPEPQQTEPQSSELQSSETQSSGSQTSAPLSSEPLATEPQPSEPQPSGSQSSEPQMTENASTNASDEVDTTNITPTELRLSGQAVDENAEGAIVGSLSVTDQDSGDSHSFSVSDDRFEVVDGQVKLRDGISLDHEEAAELTLEVTVTDSGGASFSQSFDVAVAEVNETPTELSLSNRAIAENTEGAIVGSLSVTDQDSGDSHSFSVSDDRFEVVDGQVKLRDGISLDHEEAAELTLEVTVTDSGGASFSQSFDVAVAEVPDVSLGTGFHARYFDMDQSIETVGDVDWNGAATHQELVDDINYTNSSRSFWDGGSTDTFGVQITGNIEVEEFGVFNFHIGGDDGVVLYIDGKEVVDNDGLHGFQTRSGEVELEPGAHVVEVRYFENYGHAGLKVEWEGPGIEGRELLTPPEVGDLQTVNGMPLALDLQTNMPAMADGELSQMIEGLPPGTLVQSGEMVIDVDETGSADISGWDTSMLMVTPPVDFTGQVDAQVTTRVTLESGDTAGTATDISFTVDQAEITAAPLDLKAGFRASYFDVDHNLNELSDVNWDADPTKEEVIGEVNFTNGRDSFWEGGSKDTFGVRITGEITVDEAGSYDFFVGGDDGVVLYVDGVEVVDNDRLHSYRTKSGEIELEPGPHDIEIRYFENHGHAGLKLEWEGPGTDGRELVQANTELEVQENGALELQLTNADISAEGSVIMSGLPEGTILVSGSDSCVADGSDIDLSNWDLDLIELMPPNGFEGIISAEISVTDSAFNGQQVQRTETFEIEVGDVENAPQTEQSHDEILIADAGAPEAGDQGWADNAAISGDECDDASDDDVMDEQITESQSAEQSCDSVETYERSDW